ncbi:hypothetical protein [Aestuariirhabdus litorea]|uniref:Uncharacterized protein n=1 Tax=Aestuariirhabdus litorea TaxID=2528527 RepID=A0A3P3VLK4_9GAMM|nr:hypothetical protein [Aestuariirhabdus litorea]RRJ82609.1 hypothetical protein D0544_12140 [Aestuariirhabdus litorea]RWW92768.1 hypothetical protein DZC74_12115 [Endozoicomonadaceae bacterium GTF-13]
MKKKKTNTKETYAGVTKEKNKPVDAETFVKMYVDDMDYSEFDKKLRASYKTEEDYENAKRRFSDEI